MIDPTATHVSNFGHGTPFYIAPEVGVQPARSFFLALPNVLALLPLILMQDLSFYFPSNRSRHQVAFTRQVTKLSDVFSFGIIMVELQTGEAPWIHLPDGSFGMNPDFPKFPKWTPPAFRNLVVRCLKKEAKHRPSFAEVLRCLEVGWWI